MTIIKAISELIKSYEFKNIAKQKNSEGSKYRQFLMRYNKGEAQIGIMIDLLIKHGYEIEITPPDI